MPNPHRGYKRHPRDSSYLQSDQKLRIGLFGVSKYSISLQANQSKPSFSRSSPRRFVSNEIKKTSESQCTSVVLHTVAQFPRITAKRKLLTHTFHVRVIQRRVTFVQSFSRSGRVSARQRNNRENYRYSIVDFNRNRGSLASRSLCIERRSPMLSPCLSIEKALASSVSLYVKRIRNTFLPSGEDRKSFSPNGATREAPLVS